MDTTALSGSRVVSSSVLGHGSEATTGAAGDVDITAADITDMAVADLSAAVPCSQGELRLAAFAEVMHFAADQSKGAAAFMAVEHSVVGTRSMAGALMEVNSTAEDPVAVDPTVEVVTADADNALSCDPGS